MGMCSMMSRPAMTRDLMSNRRELQGKIVTIFAADNTRDECEELERGVPTVYPIT